MTESKQRPLKVAIVGFGTVATWGHLPTYQSMSNISVTAVVDPVGLRQEEALRLVPGVKVYKSLVDLLQDYDHEVDIVDICSPPVFHGAALQRALEADKHVICEKPLVLNTVELEAVLQLVLTHRRLLYPCHNYKFAPSLQRAAQVIDSGQIGIPRFGSFQIFRAGCARGVPQWETDWRKFPALAGGGIMVDHGWHAIYIAQVLFGRSPKRVSATTSNMVHDKSQTEDTALFCLDFGDAVVHTSLSWVTSTRKSSFLVQGTRGELHVDGDVVELTEDGQPTKHYITPSLFDDSSHPAWFREMFLDFEQHLAAENFRPSSLVEAAVTTDVIEQAYRSSVQGGGWMPIRQAAL